MSYLTIEQFAYEVHEHPETIRRKIMEGKITAHKPGKRWLINSDEIDRYVTSDQQELDENDRVAALIDSIHAKG